VSLSPSNAGKERIVVAMSGGVDSAVAAARLHDAGYDVVGVTLHLWDYPEDSRSSSDSCTSRIRIHPCGR